ncbi:hypothetical protein C8Q77DRAFT_1158137 [Trametes polyzona]|nr:hypothetical protein C8Q77DRAFT_1158137 [Trametes polyzona]
MSLNTTAGPPAPDSTLQADGLTTAGDLNSSLSILLVGTIGSAFLVPISTAVLFFSSQKAHQRPMFLLILVSLVLGVGEGALNMYNQINSIRHVAVPTAVTTTYTFVHLFLPLINEFVLVFRVTAMHPIKKLTRHWRVLLYGPITLFKIARFVLLVSIAVSWIANTRNLPAPVRGGLDALTEINKLPSRVRWALQLADTLFMSAVFFPLQGLKRHPKQKSSAHPPARPTAHPPARESASHGPHGHEPAEPTFFKRLVILFWAAVSSFVFPMLLNAVQFVLVLVQDGVLQVPALFAVNNQAGIIGMVFATIWQPSLTHSTGVPASAGGTAAEAALLHMAGLDPDDNAGTSTAVSRGQTTARPRTARTATERSSESALKDDEDASDRVSAHDLPVLLLDSRRESRAVDEDVAEKRSSAGSGSGVLAGLFGPHSRRELLTESVDGGNLFGGGRVNSLSVFTDALIGGVDGTLGQVRGGLRNFAHGVGESASREVGGRLEDLEAGMISEEKRAVDGVLDTLGIHHDDARRTLATAKAASPARKSFAPATASSPTRKGTSPTKASTPGKAPASASAPTPRTGATGQSSTNVSGQTSPGAESDGTHTFSSGLSHMLSGVTGALAGGFDEAVRQVRGGVQNFAHDLEESAAREVGSRVERLEAGVVAGEKKAVDGMLETLGIRRDAVDERTPASSSPTKATTPGKATASAKASASPGADGASTSDKASAPKKARTDATTTTKTQAGTKATPSRAATSPQPRLPHPATSAPSKSNTLGPAPARKQTSSAKTAKTTTSASTTPATQAVTTSGPGATATGLGVGGVAGLLGGATLEAGMVGSDAIFDGLDGVGSSVGDIAGMLGDGVDGALDQLRDVAHEVGDSLIADTAEKMAERLEHSPVEEFGDVGGVLSGVVEHHVVDDEAHVRT